MNGARVMRNARPLRLHLGALALSLVAPIVHAIDARTGGSFATSNVGGAEYSIPIVVPPGVNGLTPVHTLRYSSQAGNGLMGVGWTISGFSAITRCHATKAQHGERQAVQLDSGDVFCLDGNALRSIGTSAYRGEIENFSRITSSGTAGSGPQSFVVETKDGRLLTYGGSLSSRIKGFGSATIRAWLLSSVADRSGNSIAIEYYDDTTNGSYRPWTVTWNNRAGNSPLYKIEFIYETRPDPIYGYVAGGPAHETQRLRRVEVTRGGSIVTRRYWVNYETAPVSGRSRVQSIQECGVGADCALATTFAHHNGVGGYAATTSTMAGAQGVSLELSAVGDFNGDGRSDIAFVSTASGGTAQTGKIYYVLANAAGSFDGPYDTGLIGDNTPGYMSLSADQDTDGDGRSELSAGFYSGGGWFSYEMGTPGGPFVPISSTAPGLRMDVDGDGRDDSVRLISAWPNYVTTDLASGGDTTAFALATNQTFAGDSLFASNFGLISQTPVDFNGDGRADLGIVTASGVTAPHTFRALLSAWDAASGAKFVEGSTSITFDPTSTANFHSGFVPLDVNGDGCTDVLQIVSPEAKLFISNCGRAGSTDVFRPAITTPLILPVNVFLAKQQFQVIDWDGDGQQDVLYSGVIYRSTGTNLANGVAAGLPARSPTLPPMLTGDFNGDGQQDLLYDVGSSIVWLPHAGSTVPDLLTSVNDGFSYVTGVTYGTTTIPTLHYPAPIDYPHRSLNRPLYVVSMVTRNDSNGTNWDEYLYYFGGATELTGRGFSGFATVYRYDGRNGQRRYENFYRLFPFTGSLSSRAVYSSNWTLVNYDVVQMGALPYGSGFQLSHHPYQAVLTQHKYELNGPYNGVKTWMQETAVGAIDSGSGTPTIVHTTSTEPQGSNGVNGGQTHVSTMTIPTGFLLSDTTTWCLGRAQKMVLTNTHSGFGGTTASPRTTTTSWDSVKCRPSSTVVEPGGSMEVSTALAYDGFGNLQTESITPASPAVFRSRSTYFDAATGIFPKTLVNEMGEVTEQTYDFSIGAIESRTDANNRTTSFEFDALGRRKRETRPDGTYTTWTYTLCTSGCDPRVRLMVAQAEFGNGNGWLGQTVDYLDRLDQSVYSYRWSWLLEAPNTYVMNYRGYDSLGRKTYEYFPRLATTGAWFYESFEYDELNRLTARRRPVSATDSTQQSTTIGYFGRSLLNTDAEGRTNIQVTDAMGRVVRSTDGGGYYVHTDYDAFGNRVQVVDSDGKTLQSALYNVRGFALSMTDLDLGATGFTPDAFGQVISQTDALGQTLTFEYDKLGRRTKQTMPGTGSNIVREFVWGHPGLNTPTNKYVGELYYSTVYGGGVTSYTETHVRDALARAVLTQYTAGGEVFNVNRGYNTANGLLDVLVLPESPPAAAGWRLALKYEYAGRDPIRVVHYDNPANVFWQANRLDVWGNVDDESFYNGLRTRRTFDVVTGWVGSIQTGPNGGSWTSFQNLSYGFYRNGNLARRQDLNLTLTEQFYYDAVNRLDYSTRNGVQNLDLSYSANGNVTGNSALGAGTYAYHPTRIHAVTSAPGGLSYTYDSNGNIITRNGAAVGWYADNRPRSIASSSGELSIFEYGADGQYWKQTATYGNGPETTTYIGGLFERVVGGTVTAYRNYIKVGDRTVGIWTYRTNGNHVGYHPLRDHLGSTDAVTDHTGQLIVRESYEAYGKRRDPLDWVGPPSSGPGSDLEKIANTGRRGFTQHTMLDNLSLIHMNGRVFDLVIGRFVSADPFIDVETDAQGWNRYSYVKNNPLSFTDPTGFYLADIGRTDSMDRLAMMLQAGCVIGGCAFGNPLVGGGWRWSAVGGVARQTPKEGSASSRAGPPPASSMAAAGTSLILERIAVSLDAFNEQKANKAKWARLVGTFGEVEAARWAAENGYVVVAQQLYVRTSAGLRITDLVVRRIDDLDPRNYLGLEAKVNHSTRSSRQERKDQLIEREGGRVVSKGLTGAFEYGKEIKYKTQLIYVCDEGVQCP